MNCHCTNSIKFLILNFLEKNDTLYRIEDLIEKIYVLVKASIEKKEIDIEPNENYIKTYLNTLLHEMANKDKNIILKVIQNTNDNYYYMKIAKEKIEDIFKQEETSNKKEENTKNEEKENKIKELIELKKQYEEIKKKNNKNDLIKVLHKYNDLKDISQELLGRIAMKKNMTIKELYQEMDISVEDE